jgi:hypothetical protein
VEESQRLQEALEETETARQAEVMELKRQEAAARDECEALKDRVARVGREKEAALAAAEEAREEVVRQLRKERDGRDVETSALKDAIGWVCCAKVQHSCLGRFSSRSRPF